MLCLFYAMVCMLPVWTWLFFSYRMKGVSVLFIVCIFLAGILWYIPFSLASWVSFGLGLPFFVWLIYALYLATGVWILNPDPLDEQDVS